MLPVKPLSEKPKSQKKRIYKLKIADDVKDKTEGVKDIRYQKLLSITHCKWCNRNLISTPYREYWCDLSCCGFDNAFSRVT